uniref:Uncharacterized protein n=1 Tax=Bicosoecida sp. CB-2014 TaxID=1486930 RepID=A0A7S1CPH8_9STRA
MATDFAPVCADSCAAFVGGVTEAKAVHAILSSVLEAQPRRHDSWRRVRVCEVESTKHVRAWRCLQLFGRDGDGEATGIVVTVRALLVGGEAEAYRSCPLLDDHSLISASHATSGAVASKRPSLVLDFQVEAGCAGITVQPSFEWQVYDALAASGADIGTLAACSTERPEADSAPPSGSPLLPRAHSAPARGSHSGPAADRTAAEASPRLSAQEEQHVRVEVSEHVELLCHPDTQLGEALEAVAALCSFSRRHGSFAWKAVCLAVADPIEAFARAGTTTTLTPDDVVCALVALAGGVDAGTAAEGGNAQAWTAALAAGYAVTLLSDIASDARVADAIALAGGVAELCALARRVMPLSDLEHLVVRGAVLSALRRAAEASLLAAEAMFTCDYETFGMRRLALLYEECVLLLGCEFVEGEHADVCAIEDRHRKSERDAGWYPTDGRGGVRDGEELSMVAMLCRRADVVEHRGGDHGWAEAARLWRRAYDALAGVYRDTDNLSSAHTAFRLGRALVRTKEPVEATELLERALSVYESVRGSAPTPERCEMISVLAESECDTGALEAAEGNFKRATQLAAQLAEAGIGAKELHVAALRGLARVLDARGSPGDAVTARALEVEASSVSEKTPLPAGVEPTRVLVKSTAPAFGMLRHVLATAGMDAAPDARFECVASQYGTRVRVALEAADDAPGRRPLHVAISHLAGDVADFDRTVAALLAALPSRLLRDSSVTDGAAAKASAMTDAVRQRESGKGGYNERALQQAATKRVKGVKAAPGAPSPHMMVEIADAVTDHLWRHLYFSNDSVKALARAAGIVGTGGDTPTPGPATQTNQSVETPPPSDSDAGGAGTDAAALGEAVASTALARIAQSPAGETALLVASPRAAAVRGLVRQLAAAAPHADATDDVAGAAAVRRLVEALRNVLARYGPAAAAVVDEATTLEMSGGPLTSWPRVARCLDAGVRAAAGQLASRIATLRGLRLEAVGDDWVAPTPHFALAAGDAKPRNVSVDLWAIVAIDMALRAADVDAEFDKDKSAFECALHSNEAIGTVAFRLSLVVCRAGDSDDGDAGASSTAVDTVTCFPSRTVGDPVGYATALAALRRSLDYADDRAFDLPRAAVTRNLPEQHEQLRVVPAGGSSAGGSSGRAAGRGIDRSELDMCATLLTQDVNEQYNDVHNGVVELMQLIRDATQRDYPALRAVVSERPRRAMSSVGAARAVLSASADAGSRSGRGSATSDELRASMPPAPPALSIDVTPLESLSLLLRGFNRDGDPILADVIKSTEFVVLAAGACALLAELARIAPAEVLASGAHVPLAHMALMPHAYLAAGRRRESLRAMLALVRAVRSGVVEVDDADLTDFTLDVVPQCREWVEVEWSRTGRRTMEDDAIFALVRDIDVAAHAPAPTSKAAGKDDPAAYDLDNPTALWDAKWREADGDRMAMEAEAADYRERLERHRSEEPPRDVHDTEELVAPPGRTYDAAAQVGNYLVKSMGGPLIDPAMVDAHVLTHADDAELPPETTKVTLPDAHDRMARARDYHTTGHILAPEVVVERAGNPVPYVLTDPSRVFALDHWRRLMDEAVHPLRAFLDAVHQHQPWEAPPHADLHMSGTRVLQHWRRVWKPLLSPYFDAAAHGEMADAIDFLCRAAEQIADGVHLKQNRAPGEFNLRDMSLIERAYGHAAVLFDHIAGKLRIAILPRARYDKWIAENRADSGASGSGGSGARSSQQQPSHGKDTARGGSDERKGGESTPTPRPDGEAATDDGPDDEKRKQIALFSEAREDALRVNDSLLSLRQTLRDMNMYTNRTMWFQRFFTRDDVRDMAESTLRRLLREVEEGSAAGADAAARDRADAIARVVVRDICLRERVAPALRVADDGDGGTEREAAGGAGGAAAARRRELDHISGALRDVDDLGDERAGEAQPPCESWVPGRWNAMQYANAAFASQWRSILPSKRKKLQPPRKKPP